MQRKWISGMLLAAAIGMMATRQAAALTVKVSDFMAGSFTSKGGQAIVYRLFVPKNYNKNTAYPIMLTLHGAGERGVDDSLQLKYPFSILWADDSVQSLHPCFVLSPQCPNNSSYGWVNTPWGGGTYNYNSVPISADLQAVVELLDSVSRAYSIDTLREFVSGMSMGGYASWYLTMRFPQHFAALVPVCGAADTTRAASIQAVPIWAFHAADDPTVPVTGSEQMIAALIKAGGHPQYTEYPANLGIGHSAWIPAAQDTGLVPWVFRQQRTPTALFRPRRLSTALDLTPWKPGAWDVAGRRNGLFPALIVPPLR